MGHVIQIDIFRQGNLSSVLVEEQPRVISQYVATQKNLGYHVRDVSRGVDDFPFVEILFVEDEADLEVPFVEVQGKYVHLVFSALPDYESGYDLSMVEP